GLNESTLATPLPEYLPRWVALPVALCGESAPKGERPSGAGPPPVTLKGTTCAFAVWQARVRVTARAVRRTTDPRGSTRRIMRELRVRCGLRAGSRHADRAARRGVDTRPPPTLGKAEPPGCRTNWPFRLVGSASSARTRAGSRVPKRRSE